MSIVWETEADLDVKYARVAQSTANHNDRINKLKAEFKQRKLECIEAYFDKQECDDSVIGLKRVYLYVSYKEKDEAKKHGARWDPQLKKWYALQKNIELINKYSN